VQKALGYLVGEKLLNHGDAAETRPAFTWTLPASVISGGR